VATVRAWLDGIENFQQVGRNGLVVLSDINAAMLGEGWGPSATRDGAESRPVQGRARLLAPLDVPEDIDVAVRAQGEAPAKMQVEVNGHVAGVFDVAPGWADHRVTVPRRHWRRNLNDVVLAAEGAVWIDTVDFLRAGVPEGQERGFRAR